MPKTKGDFDLLKGNVRGFVFVCGDVENVRNAAAKRRMRLLFPDQMFEMKCSVLYGQTKFDKTSNRSKSDAIINSSKVEYE